MCDLPLAYSSKYWKITLGKFLPTDLSSLFKPQQWLSLKKLGANTVKSPNTIQHFHKSFCGKANRRGIAPSVHSGAYSCFEKKKKPPQFDHACKTSWFLFQPVPIFVGNLAHNFIRLSLSNEPFLLNKIMCFPVFMTHLHFCCFMQITHWA